MHGNPAATFNMRPFELVMIKLELPHCQHHEVSRARWRGGLIVAAVVGALAWAQAAQGFGEGGSRSLEASARRTAGWRLALSEDRSRGPVAALRAAQVWTVHKRTGRPASATLAIRCAQGGRLGVYVSFPDRSWQGDAVVAYKLGRGEARPVRPPLRESSGTEWLGGDELVRELARSEVLQVFIDDIGLGLSEAVFRLAGIKAIARQVEEACEAERAPLVLRVPPDRTRAAGREPDQRKPSGKALEERQTRPEPEPTAPIEIPEPEGRSPAGPRTDHPNAEPPSPPNAEPPDRPNTEPPDPPKAQPPDPPKVDRSEPPGSIAAPSTGAPAPEPPPSSPQAPEAGGQPSKEADNAMAPPAVAAVTPPPRPSDPVDGRSVDQARFEAFFQTYGPNRQGEPIYGWYRRCLDHARVESGRVWYLSREELTYLSKGETDRVRLSMLISTERDPAVPPRRLTCYGSARGRDLSIERVE